MIWSYAHHGHIPIDFVNNGDDCVVFLERAHEAQFRAGVVEWCTRFGFRMEVEPTVDVFERIEFCQMHPVLGPDGYRMMRSPWTCLSKDTQCVKNCNKPEDFIDWFYELSGSGLAAWSGMPCLQPLYAYGRSRGKHRDHLVEESGMRFLVRNMEACLRPVTEATRYSFFRAFGVTPDVQMALEETDWSFDCAIEQAAFANWPDDDLHHV